MTTRSAASSSSIREDSSVYSYALRVAVLSYAIASSSHSSASTSLSHPISATSSSSSTGSHAPGAALRHASSFRPTDGWTSVFSFGSESGKDGGAVKFPKEFLKVLDTKISAVARGADASYIDPLFRSTIGAFYGTFADPAEQKKMREQRQIEQVIVLFVRTATTVLKKRLGADEWKGQLNAQVGYFLSVVRDCLRSKDVGRVPAELLQRLETYCGGLVEGASSNESIQSTSRLTLDVPGSANSSSQGFATNLGDMPLVRAVGTLFGKTNAELTKDVVAIRRLCTEKAAFNDLKVCINNLAQGARFPARREDFDSDDAFQAWRKQESDELQELLLEMIKRNPDLVHSAAPSEISPRASEMGSTRSSLNALAYPLSPDTSSNSNVSLDEDTSSYAFVFVPPDPKYYYKRLFEIALDYDHQALAYLPPDQDVSLTILSSIHEELLRDCETRWRISAPLRASTFLALIYKYPGVPEPCLMAAMSGVEQVGSTWSYWRWPWSERQYLFKSLSALFDILLSRFFEIFQGILDLPFDDVVQLLETIHSNEIFSEDIQGLDIVLDELQEGMRKFVGFAYEEKQADVDSLPRRHDLEPFLAMLDWMRREAKGYDSRFPGKLLDAIDVPAIFIGVAAPEFVKHLDASRTALLAAASQETGSAHDSDLLDLYRGIIELQKMHNTFCPDSPLLVDFSAWFEPYIRRWLLTTDAKTMEWVKLAIAHDKFQPEGVDSHSSSVVDLIDSCKSATNFIIDLKWPNEYENARYLTALSQTVAKAIEQYSHQLEALFLEEMRPPRATDGKELETARPSAWLTKAKLVVQGDKKVEPFTFQPESCVKLNNIQAARKLLDTMYTTLDADKVARIVEMNAPPLPDKTGPARFLFTVKIVLAENLVGADGSTRSKVDPYLILSDSEGHRVAKTRTLYQTNDPRWDETTDVSVQGDRWLRATVYHRNLVEHHDWVASAFIHLNPNEYGDFLARDVWLQLEDSNRQVMDSRLLLRISMEGEKDDIQFYFGRAFRSLKRAENDMTRTMVDVMLPFVRNYLSLNTLKGLIKTSYNFDIDLERVRGDFNKVSGKLNAYVRDALSNTTSPLIPPVEDYSASPAAKVEKKKGRGPLTDQEIEDAIGDLFDYFNETFGTLKEYLSQEAWDLVISRLWKDILSTIEALIVPPLSDQATEMKPLSDKAVDIVFKWLGFLVNFFHAGGEGVPLEDLRNAKYRELIEARMYYDWKPDQLMEEAVRSMQRTLLSKSDTILGRSKSVYSQRNLGTIRARKIEKKQSHAPSGEMILRILRMHPGTSDFLAQQMQTMLRLQADQAKQKLTPKRRELATNGARNRLGGVGRGSRHDGGAVPALPTIADVYRA